MLVHAATFNLGFVMRTRFGFDTPRGLQGLRAAQVALAHDLNAAVLHMLDLFQRHIGFERPIVELSGCNPRGCYTFTTV